MSSIYLRAGFSIRKSNHEHQYEAKDDQSPIKHLSVPLVCDVCLDHSSPIAGHPVVRVNSLSWMQHHSVLAMQVPASTQPREEICDAIGCKFMCRTHLSNRGACNRTARGRPDSEIGIDQHNANCISTFICRMKAQYYL
jgi:hypothetical protein